MTDKQFATIVSKSEELAKTRPAYYQRKLWLLAVLGNLYLAVVLLTMIALQAVLLFVHCAGGDGNRADRLADRVLHRCADLDNLGST